MHWWHSDCPYPEIDDLRETWYPDENERFPDGLELTPTITKFRYVSDGYLDVGQWGRPRVESEARNESVRADRLVARFEAVGSSPTFRRNELRFTCDDAERLVDWMGEAPPGFADRWELDSRERYRRLKARACDEYATATRSDE